MDKLLTMEWGLAGGHAQVAHDPNKIGHCTGISGFASLKYWKPNFDRYDYSECVFLDKYDCLDENSMLAVLCPLPDTRLKSGDVERCPQPDPIMAYGMAGNSFGQLLALQEATRNVVEIGPLDTVDIEAYILWWRKRGARVGKLIDAVIVWE